MRIHMDRDNYEFLHEITKGSLLRSLWSRRFLALRADAGHRGARCKLRLCAPLAKDTVALATCSIHQLHRSNSCLLVIMRRLR